MDKTFAAFYIALDLIEIADASYLVIVQHCLDMKMSQLVSGQQSKNYIQYQQKNALKI